MSNILAHIAEIPAGLDSVANLAQVVQQSVLEDCLRLGAPNYTTLLFSENKIIRLTLAESDPAKQDRAQVDELASQSRAAAVAYNADVAALIVPAMAIARDGDKPAVFESVLVALQDCTGGPLRALEYAIHRKDGEIVDIQTAAILSEEQARRMFSPYLVWELLPPKNPGKTSRKRGNAARRRSGATVH